MRKADEIISEVESLPINIRTKLVDKLLKSLNPCEKEIDELWANEAERRVKEIKAGKVKTISGQKVLNDVHKRINS